MSSHPQQGGLTAWSADPDYESAYSLLLHWLANTVGSIFLPETEPFTNTIKGNLGEFVGYQIGRNYAFVHGEIAHSANASAPLSRISRSGLDVVWMYFGANPSEDWAAIQEIKTTGQGSLGLADELADDYAKLYGTDHRVRLEPRLYSLMSVLRELGLGQFSPRLTALGGPGPNSTTGIYLLPTLIHDSSNESSTKMLAVRQTILGQGWPPRVVNCWSVGLNQLDGRLERLARGQP